MSLMIRTLTFSMLLLALVGCSKSNQAKNVLDAATEKKIRDLVEQLASENSPPIGDGWPGLDYPKDWDSEKQKIVYDAKRKLGDFGKSAFPILLESSGDSRYSLTASYSIEVNHSVGEVCEQIIENNVRLIGIRYKSRTGTDGEWHMCPNYFSAKHNGDLNGWWRANKNKSLKQMRIDVLKWRIEQEGQIGFPDDESRKSYMDELHEKLAEVESSA